MMLRYLLVTILFVLNGCASVGGIEITEANKHVDTPYFSVILQPGGGWQIKEGDNPNALNLQKVVGSNAYLMMFSTNYVVDEKKKSWTAKQVADDYRASEQLDMMLKGAIYGKYQLVDVIKDEIQVGDKKYFTMSYTTISSGTKRIKQRAVLYLYFPKEKDFGRFLVSIYSEAFPENEPPPQSYKDVFLGTLNAVKLKE